MNLVLDTNVIIAAATNEPPYGDAAGELLQKAVSGTHTITLSVMTVAELMAVFARVKDPKKAAETIILVKEAGIGFRLIDERLAAAAGLLKAKYATTKKGFSYGDAMILATAITIHADALVTTDPEFAGVTEVPIRKPSDM